MRRDIVRPNELINEIFKFDCHIESAIPKIFYEERPLTQSKKKHI